jgi:RNA polymerase sigma-70 factor (ECF subfamily)
VIYSHDMSSRPSLEQLYAAWAPDVRRFAFWLTRDAAAADDITSETFVRAWTRFESIRTESVKGYLLAIARNLALAEMRRRRRQRPLDDEHRDPGRDPAARAEQRVEMDVVLDAVTRLPQGEREALLLRVVEQLPYEEVARVLGISVVAAKVRVHRARAHLIARTGRTPGD